MASPVAPVVAIEHLKTFINQQALPLWRSSGFDGQSLCFHERLSFSGEPVRDVPYRLLVQCRQVGVFARASVQGWHKDHQQQTLDAFEMACKRYRSPDGCIGWVFSVSPDGKIADPTRDLYTHAFVLYMLAWVYRMSGDPAVIKLADSTLSEIDLIFAVSDGPGLRSKVPGRTDLREQNPHMHLFEALLALADASGAERYMARAAALVQLFDQALADPATGAVRELFDASWRPSRPAGENAVEPGHQMEWAWLLREWQRLSGVLQGERVGRLTAHATTFGIDMEKGLVRGIVREDGAMVSNASRVWQQTEAIRSLCREDPSGVTWPGLVSAITENLFKCYLPAHLNGGWIDQMDENGRGVIDYMPASTLYHLVGAVIDGEGACEDVDVTEVIPCR
jgi:mannose/cellobiose epimerase-like protein (N-acyl-D-glucosamine 2-epimerase family)